MTARAKMVAAARAEWAPGESWWGGEQRLSAPHPTALAGHGWAGGMQGATTSSSEALAAPVCWRLVAKESPQR